MGEGVGGHGNQTQAKGLHGPVTWDFADAAARTAFTPASGRPSIVAEIDADDVGKWALQIDDGSVWRLDSIGPNVWSQINPTGGAHGHAATEITYDNTALDLTATEAQGAIDELATHVNTLTSTGVLKGSVTTINAGDPAQFDIAAGVGDWMDFTDPANPTHVRKAYSAFIGESLPDIATEVFTQIHLALVAGVVTVVKVGGPAGQTTPQSRRTQIPLQIVEHRDNATITNITKGCQPSYNQVQGLLDYVNALGPVIKGNSYSAASNDLTVAKSSGQSTLPYINQAGDPDNPTVLDNAADSPHEWLTSFRDGAGGWTFGALTTIVDAANYDNDDVGGLPVAVTPTNRWQIKRIYFYAQANESVMVYGQALYASLSAAEQALLTESPEIDPLVATGVLKGALFVRGDCTDLSDPTTAVFKDITSNTSSASVSTSWGDVLGTLADQLDLQAALDAKLASGDAAGGDLNGTYPNPSVDDGADATAIHDDTAGEIAALTLVTAVGGDHLIIEDASDANNKKRIAASDFLAGAGDVAGPASSTDNAITRFDLATGKVIQNSLATVDDSGNIGVPGAATVDGRDVSVDGTKLDGIEASADVTDTTNVTAAGAHMSGGTDVPVADGGTGSSTASAARTALGLAIGSDVQAHDAVLDATTASFLTADETKLDGIEALADVTDAANVTTAGAFLKDGTVAMTGDVDANDNNLDNYQRARSNTETGGTTGAVTYDCNAGNDFSSDLATGNVTSVTVSNKPGAGKSQMLRILFTQDTTPRTIPTTWTGVDWWTNAAGGPVMPTGSGKTLIVTIVIIGGKKAVGSWVAEP